MNRITIRVLSLILSLCFCVTSVYYVYASTDEKKVETDGKKEEKTAQSEEIPYKNETVYVLADADGTVNKIIVSDYIKNRIASKSISDKSELKNIKNVKGKEEYSIGGDNTIVWDAEGNDIYYQGEIEKELPVALSISYAINGENVSAKDLVGKSGKVKINFSYKNNKYETVNINGKNEKIYVPFVMLTGLMLDNDIFSNVEITNGKIINDGDRSICIGYSLPGMKESLGIDDDIFKIPDGFSITADVKKFKMGMTVTLATSGLFSCLDTSKLDTSDIDGSIKQLSDGLDKLIDGTSKLYGGIETLSVESSRLINGINELAKGVNALKDGAKSAYNGASDIDNGVGEMCPSVGKLDDGTSALATGAASLYSGLDTLCQNNEQLNGGAEKVFSGLVTNVSDSFAAEGIVIDNLSISNYEAKLNSLLNNPTEAQKATLISIASSGLDQKFDSNGIPSAYFGACKYLLATGKTEEDIAYALAANPELIASAAAAAETAEGKYAIEMLCLGVAKSTLTPKINEAINALNEYKTFLSGLKAYTDGVAAAKTGAGAISENLGNLKAGTAALKDGVLKLKDGTALLKGGLYQLSDGVDTLFDGVLTIKNGMPQLADGIGKLKDGSKALDDGIKQFKNEGIGKIVSVYNGDIKEIVVRVKAIVDVSKGYKSFSGLDDFADGTVKFIYRTDEIN